MKPVFVEISAEPMKPGRAWTDPKTGTVKMLPGEQKAYLHAGGEYPTPFAWKVEADGPGPLKPGKYLIGGDCFRANENGQLVFRKYDIELIPLDLAIAALQPVEPAKKLAAA